MSCFRAFGRKRIPVVVLLFGYVNARPVVFQQPVGPFNGLFTMTISYRALISMRGFYRCYKTHRWIFGSFTCSFVIVALRFYYACALHC
jgi:hypothetical protein